MSAKLKVIESSINVNGEMREYRMVIPDDLNESAPLWFVYHGYRGDVKVWMHEHTGLDELAGEKGFMAVYPKTTDSVVLNLFS